MSDDDLNEREDNSSMHTVSSRSKIRDQLSSEVEAFLARGGQIQHVATHMRAELAKAAQSSQESADPS